MSRKSSTSSSSPTLQFQHKAQPKVAFQVDRNHLSSQQLSIVDSIINDNKQQFQSSIMHEQLNFTINSELVFPLLMVSALGRVQLLRVMLSKPSLNLNLKDRHGLNAFWIAAFYGQSEIVQILYSTSIDKNCVNGNGSNALHIAAKQEHFNVVQTLVELNFPVNQTKYNGVTAVGIAAHKGNLRIVKYLVESGANLNLSTKFGISALILAIKAGSAECSGYLVSRIAAIYYHNPQQVDNSPIFYAIKLNQIGCLESIIENTFEPVSQLSNSEGLSLLHFAYQYGSDEAVLMLLSILRDQDQEDPAQRSLLMKYLFLKKDITMALNVIQRGANINYQNASGNTALHLAIQLRDEQSINFLLSRNANPHLENLNGKDCCDLARENGISKFPELNRCIRHHRETYIKINQNNGQSFDSKISYVQQSVAQKLNSIVSKSPPKKTLISPYQERSLSPFITDSKKEKSLLKLEPLVPMFDLNSTIEKKLHHQKVLQNEENQRDLYFKEKFKQDLEQDPIKRLQMFDISEFTESIDKKQKKFEIDTTNQFFSTLGNTVSKQNFQDFTLNLDLNIDKLIRNTQIEKALNQTLIENMEYDKLRRTNTNSALKQRREVEKSKNKNEFIKEKEHLANKITATTESEKELLDLKFQQLSQYSTKIYDDKYQKYCNKLNHVLESSSRYRSKSQPKSHIDGFDYYLQRHLELQNVYSQFKDKQNNHKLSQEYKIPKKTIRDTGSKRLDSKRQSKIRHKLEKELLGQAFNASRVNFNNSNASLNKLVVQSEIQNLLSSEQAKTPLKEELKKIRLLESTQMFNNEYGNDRLNNSGYSNFQQSYTRFQKPSFTTKFKEQHSTVQFGSPSSMRSKNYSVSENRLIPLKVILKSDIPSFLNTKTFNSGINTQTRFGISSRNLIPQFNTELSSTYRNIPSRNINMRNISSNFNPADYSSLAYQHLLLNPKVKIQ